MFNYARISWTLFTTTWIMSTEGWQMWADYHCVHNESEQQTRRQIRNLFLSSNQFLFFLDYFELCSIIFYEFFLDQRRLWPHILQINLSCCKTIFDSKPHVLIIKSIFIEKVFFSECSFFPSVLLLLLSSCFPYFIQIEDQNGKNSPFEWESSRWSNRNQIKQCYKK